MSSANRNSNLPRNGNNPYIDDARAVETLKQFLDGKALKPFKVAPADKKMISARISQPAHLGLQQIAQRLGYTFDGHGNLSMLLEAIGTGVVTVTQTVLSARQLD